MPLKIVRNDMIRMKVDAVVNSANSRLKQGGGVCGVIFDRAGAAELAAECDAIGSCGPGQAVITKGCDLPAKYIIHTVGPVWQGGAAGEEQLLRSCYLNSLELAVSKGCESIAFPLISSGINGYPKEEALQTALDVIGEFLLRHELDVCLAVYDREAFAISKTLFADIERYIDDNYVDEHKRCNKPIKSRRESCERLCLKEEREGNYAWSGVSYSIALEHMDAQVKKKGRRLEDLPGTLEEPFSDMLFRLIDEKGMKDAEVYKRANINRQLFSKIRCNRDYRPSKGTALALAVSLCLTLDETMDLIGRAGYALSKSIKADVIIEYFIQQGQYDILAINAALFDFRQPLLGG